MSSFRSDSEPAIHSSRHFLHERFLKLVLSIYVPWSKVAILGMVIPPLIGNPYNGYINPYYWVDDHPLLYGNNGSLDPSTYDYLMEEIRRSPVGRYFIMPLFARFYTSQVLQEFFQQYFESIPISIKRN